MGLIGQRAFGQDKTRKHKEKDMDETDILKERKERILAYMESEGYVPIKRRDMRCDAFCAAGGQRKI